MNAAAVGLLIARLPREEGTRNDPYDDATGVSVRAPVGHVTWGRGFNLEEVGSEGLYDAMEQYLVGKLDSELTLYPWYRQTTDAVRQSVLLDMAYNLGVEGLVVKFPRMLNAVLLQDWVRAAAECAVRDASLNASRYAPLRALLLKGSTQLKVPMNKLSLWWQVHGAKITATGTSLLALLQILQKMDPNIINSMFGSDASKWVTFAGMVYTAYHATFVKSAEAQVKLKALKSS